MPTHLLREAMAAAIEHASFRAVAEETGVSPMGLHRLLNGSEPQQRTRLKLESWYVQRTLRTGGAVTPEVASAAMRLLTLALPTSRRKAATLQVLQSWAAVYDSAKVPHPEWLIVLRQEAGG